MLMDQNVPEKSKHSITVVDILIDKNCSDSIVNTGVSLELSDRKKFCNIFRISGRSFGPNFRCSIHLIFSLSSK